MYELTIMIKKKGQRSLTYGGPDGEFNERHRVELNHEEDVGEQTHQREERHQGNLLMTSQYEDQRRNQQIRAS